MTTNNDGAQAQGDGADLARAAIEVADSGRLAEAMQVMVAAFQQDVASAAVIDTAITLLERARSQPGSSDSDEYELFLAVQRDRGSADAYYNLGSRFFHVGQPYIARPFLSRALELKGSAPDPVHHAILLELAQVEMSVSRYAEAITLFQQLNMTYGGLPIWLVLELAECYALSRMPEAARTVVDSIPSDACAAAPGSDVAIDEIGDLIARVEDLGSVPTVGLRGWHYVQTRGILLSTNTSSEVAAERFVHADLSHADVARIVGLAARFLASRGLAPDSITWFGARSEPIARLLAALCAGASADEWRPGARSDGLTLFVTAHTSDLFELPDQAAYDELALAGPGLITFAVDIHGPEAQPLAPDIGGLWSYSCRLPWEPGYEVDEATGAPREVADNRTVDEVVADLHAALPPGDELDAEAAALVDLYAACTDLILDHRDGSLHRKPVPAHSPAPGAFVMAGSPS